MSEQNKGTRNASQRIEDLERAMVSLYQTADNMARDLMTVKDAVKILHNKVSAIVTAYTRDKTFSEESVTAVMIDSNVEELKSKLNTLIEQGILVAEEVVTDASFVVGRELDDNNVVVNPRLQFTMAGVQETVRGKLVGAMSGDILLLEEGKLKFEVLETYQIQTPKAPEAAEAAPAAEAPAEATEQAPAQA